MKPSLHLIIGLSIATGTPAFAEQTLTATAAQLAATATVPPSLRTVRVAVSERYEKGRVHRFVLGGGYRDLWKTPIELPVLDLASEGGGLTPTRRFGGLQTAVLGFKGADGRSYSFRGTDKDPSQILDPALRDTFIRPIIQDQMAAQHPAGPVAARVVIEAAGVPVVEEKMVVLPDDPRLGKFREEFAGMVGSFFEYPTAGDGKRSGFMDAVEIIDHETLYEKLRTGTAGTVDVKAYLRARLLDILIGDFDRHRKQWRWGRLVGESRWWPIPEDRDQAFVRYDGVGQRLGSIYMPILQNYGPSYPDMDGLVLHGFEQDRWLLPALDWQKWSDAVDAVQLAVTNEVIDQAVAALPPEYQELDGERLRRDLRGRRDQLGQGARAFYEHLAGEVDVQSSDKAQHIVVHRNDDGDTQVELRTTGSTTSQITSFSRTFLPDETSEIRIYLRGGEDLIEVKGPASSIDLLFIADGGNKQISAPEGGVTVYDEANQTQTTQPSTVYIKNETYVAPDSGGGFVDVEGVPPRDWGSKTVPIALLGFDPDIGALLGGGVVHTRFGFRRHPWKSKHRITVGYSTGANRPTAGYNGRFRAENSSREWRIDALISGIEVLRFYGFGNETKAEGSASRFRVPNQVFALRPSAYFEVLQSKLQFEVGPFLSFSKTSSRNRLIDQVNPYGAGGFGSVGIFTKIRLDTRKTVDGLNEGLVIPLHDRVAAGYPTSGFVLNVNGRLSPPLWDVDEFWASFSGSLAGFVGFGDKGRFVVGARFGAKTTVGLTPFYEAATIGGGEFFSGDSTIRGYRAQRFSGDHALFGNLDLRLMLLPVRLLVPGDLGITAFGDVGRVFENNPTAGLGSDSTRWHPGVGGGIWFAPLQRTNTISLTAAHSREEKLLVYFRAGFHY